MSTFRFNLVPRADSFSSFLANYHHHPERDIRMKLHIVAIEAARTHGMVFGLGNSDEDALIHLRRVRDEVQGDDTGLLEDINEIIEATNREIWRQQHDAGNCGRWDCPICQEAKANEGD